MDTSPLVSVIIATYNRSNVLPYSIASALNQTCANIEVLVVGDGCTDDSQAVVECIQDPRLRWIGLPSNSGHQSEPNNVGLKEARGEFIAYLGHDDVWLPHHLQACVEMLCQGYDFVYGLTLVIAVKHSAKYLAPATLPYEPGGSIPPSGVVHRKALTDGIGGWRHYTQVDCVPELDLWRRAYHAGYKFSFVPRLAVIKIPAARRKDVYKTRSVDEQAYWLRRVQDEPDLEASELAICYANLRALDPSQLGSTPYKRLLSNLVRETAFRIGRRLNRPFWRNRRMIENFRQYKGLKPKP